VSLCSKFKCSNKFIYHTAGIFFLTAVTKWLVCIITYRVGPEGLRLFLFEIDLFISEVTGRRLIEGIVVCLLSVPVIVALNKVDKAPQNVVRKTFIFITILPVEC